MALIKCMECGNQISDKAAVCPHCGAPVALSVASPPPAEDENTADTEEWVTDSEEFTSGISESRAPVGDEPPSPVEAEPSVPGGDASAAPAETAVRSETAKKRNRIILLAVIIVAVVIVVIVVAVAGSNGKKQAERAAYIDNLSSARTTMLIGAAEAESLCNLTKSVWYNTIYEENDSSTDRYTMTGNSFNDDFNTSLQNLYADESTQETIAGIKDNQDAVAEYIRLLQNPPEDLSSCYGALDELYDAYLNFTGLAISPTGSLTTYSSAFSGYDSDFMNAYNKLGNLIPEE